MSVLPGWTVQACGAGIPAPGSEAQGQRGAWTEPQKAEQLRAEQSVVGVPG